MRYRVLIAPQPSLGIWKEITEHLTAVRKRVTPWGHTVGSHRSPRASTSALTLHGLPRTAPCRFRPIGGGTSHPAGSGAAAAKAKHLSGSASPPEEEAASPAGDAAPPPPPPAAAAAPKAVESQASVKKEEEAAPDESYADGGFEEEAPEES